MASTPFENEVQPGRDEDYEKRIKKRRGGHTHKFEGAIIPDPVADWECVNLKTHHIVVAPNRSPVANSSAC